MKEYLDITSFQPGWAKIIDKYRIGWIIYNADSGLSRYLQQRSDWKLIYADRVAHIFVRNTVEYQYLIERYPNVKPLPAEKKEQTGQ